MGSQKSKTPTIWTVAEHEAGGTLAAFIRARLDVSWNQAKQHVSTGKIFVDNESCNQVALRLRVGQAVSLRLRAPRPIDPAKQVRIVYDDAHVVVIDKPSGISSVPYEARESGTAMDLLRAAWRRKHGDNKRVPLHVVHRIDKATSGLLMFAKSKRAELGLAAQFRQHTIERLYLCVAHGRMWPGRIESYLVRDRGDGLRGSARAKHLRQSQGKRAVTHVETDPVSLRGATFCRVRLETGKTHQIRIHLAERGHPLIGENVYIRDFLASGGRVIPSSRLLLHAATLGFQHPIHGESVSLEAPLPIDFTSVVDQLQMAP